MKPDFLQSDQETLMVLVNLYVAITTFQIKGNHVTVLLGES